MTPEKSNVPKAQKTNERTALQKHRYLLHTTDVLYGLYYKTWSFIHSGLETYGD